MCRKFRSFSTDKNGIVPFPFVLEKTENRNLRLVPGHKVLELTGKVCRKLANPSIEFTQVFYLTFSADTQDRIFVGFS